ncbi:tellurite resistance TerB family protein [Thalassospira xiamenensis]|uniref:Tellurite resistance protein TerB n=1 Tax=Thalassospira xiamenensis TaxID=220697 RepID=A0A285TSL4_9PROT|nr:TerB family tellurite resistance protein [Thalassospira xiamenensis]SOC26533.1 tellurite resistance protein TerB [Thalassospira xiamenensis]
MSLWNRIKDFATEARATVVTDYKKFANRDFMIANAAAAALVACADGTVSPEEKTAIIRRMETSDELKVFKASEIIDHFNKYVQKITDDNIFGRLQVLEQVGKIAGNEQQCMALIRFVIILGTADGNFDDDEKKAVKDMCVQMKIDPSLFDL